MHLRQMYQKLNQSWHVKVTLAGIAVAMLFAFATSLPFEEVEHAQAVNALGSHFGGRVMYAIPSGYPWCVAPFVCGYCPPHVLVLSFGAPYRGPIALTLPPAIPKGWFNYITPGNAVKGGYYPAPGMQVLCPFTPYPMFGITSLMGSSVAPGL